MSRTKKDIKKDINAIERMTDCEGRLGYAISNAINEIDNSFDDMGSYLLGVIRSNPEQLDVIEEAVIAICGYSFETLREHMKAEKPDFDCL